MSAVPAACDTCVDLAGLRLAHPVLLASGTCGYGQELEAFVDFSRIGGLVTKGLSLAPRPGNRPPRIVETAAGMLNAIGLQNVGLDAFLREKLPWLQRQACVRLVNVYGTTADEYARLVAALDGRDGVDGFELNVSCPNVAAGGLELGSEPRALGDVVGRCRRATRLPLLVKLTPNTGDIRALARAAVDAGADALTVINTLRGMAVDAERRRAVLATRYGGLSGPAIKPVALALVHQVAGAVPVPVVGVGGIRTGLDAVEFLLAGATAVQVGTASLVDPAAGPRVADEISAWCRDHAVSRVADLVGRLEA